VACYHCNDFLQEKSLKSFKLLADLGIAIYNNIAGDIKIFYLENHATHFYIIDAAFENSVSVLLDQYPELGALEHFTIWEQLINYIKQAVENNNIDEKDRFKRIPGQLLNELFFSDQSFSDFTNTLARIAH
jgi:hypothetical protein